MVADVVVVVGDGERIRDVGRRRHLVLREVKVLQCVVAGVVVLVHHDHHDHYDCCYRMMMMAVVVVVGGVC